MTYEEFLASKTHSEKSDAIDDHCPPDYLYPFQQSLVEWALRIGRAAIFADCGLGKTPMQLAWAQRVVEITNRPVLVLTPLAVAQQTQREAQKFGIEATRVATLSDAKPSIYITNYEKLHHFDASMFAGVVCDESSCIKSFNGARRAEVTEFLRNMPYRLLATATAAPNDFTELGTSSEALGEMGYTDMLGRFFVDDQGRGVAQRAYGSQSRWRFKGHAELGFWRWVCSWARACRKPSDVGPFDDNGFVLPPLYENEHVVESRTLAPGMLFAMPARDLQEEREERRRTITERCERAASLVDHDKPAVIWCHLNDEGKMLSRMIPDSAEISGSTTDDAKEHIYERFSTGDLRVLVIKPKIGAWGLNWQHCAHVVTFASHSYEQYYQAVRRCWRFGQQRPVVVDVIASEGEVGIKANLQRKAEQADRMFSELVSQMNESIGIRKNEIETEGLRAPSWL